MRRRISRALFAAAAAGATITTFGFAGAASAGAAAPGPKIHFAPSGTVVGTGGVFGTNSVAAPCDTYSAFFSPPTDPTVANPTAAQHSFGGGGCAGYIGSGRDFRYAQAIIRVPQSNVIPLTSTSLGLDGSTVRTNAAQAAAPTAWVGLTSNDAIAGLAIMSCYNYVNTFLGLGSAAAPCALTGEATLHGALNYFQQQTWVAVGWVDTSGGPVIAHALALGAVTGGDGVKLALYYPAGGAVHFTVTQNPTTSSPVVTPFQLPIGGNFFAVFDHADALVDYSSSATVTETPGATFVTEATTNETGTPGPAPGSSDLRITQFQSGAWTTTGGVRGTFSPPAAARWTLTAPVLTTNGSTPPSGTTNVEPAFLWNDGIGNGFGDAFGVWWRH